MNDTLFRMTGEDGVSFDAMLTAPEGEPRGTVIFVNGSGPNTYNDKYRLPGQPVRNYHDIYAGELTKRGIAYCRYSTRGVTDGDDPESNFKQIDEKLYRTYLPHNSVSDVLRLIGYVKERYPGKPVMLLGASEGTIIAPLAALRSDDVAGLFLYGYAGENLMDIFRWQHSGEASLLTYRRYFDYDRKGYITREEVEEDRYGVREHLPTEFSERTFEEIDVDGDGKITAPDCAAAFGEPEHLRKLMKAVRRGDDRWLKKNRGILMTSAWLREHAELEPTREVLPRLEIPIHIFAGDFDTSTSISYAQDAEKRFRELGKKNLTVHYFKEHDHGLNVAYYMSTGKWDSCKGLLCLFDTIGESFPELPATSGPAKSC